MIPIAFLFGGLRKKTTKKIAKLTGMIRQVEEKILDEEDLGKGDEEKYRRHTLDKAKFNRLRLRRQERVRALRGRIRVLVKQRLNLERKAREDETEVEEDDELEHRIERDLIVEDRKEERRERVADGRTVKRVVKRAPAGGTASSPGSPVTERSAEDQKAYTWVKAFVKEYRRVLKESHPDRRREMELFTRYPYHVTLVDQGAEALLVFGKPKSEALDAVYRKKEQFDLASVADLFRTRFVELGDWSEDSARKAAARCIESDLK